MIAPKITMDDRTRETVDRFTDALLSVASAIERMADAAEAANGMKDWELNGPRG